MFRELSRKEKQLALEVCTELLKTEKRGVLSVVGDGGYPYGMPMNHWYHTDGCIYFHCGRNGHRLDGLQQNDKVSFCVMDSGTHTGGWALQVRSVIVFGRMEIIDDLETAAEITRLLCYKFTQDEQYIQQEIRSYLHETLLLKLTPEHISGKVVTEA